MIVIALPMASALGASAGLQQNGKNDVKQNMPDSFAQADEYIGLGPERNRYLMWTNDGVHIMWGFYGNGYFIGYDDQGKQAYGVYGNRSFTGYYDGELFNGKTRGFNWKAEGLFHESETSGKLVLFPVKPTPQ